MTEEQVRTYLLLGVKLKRERWTGYIYQKGGTVFKYIPEEGTHQSTSLNSWLYIADLIEFGDWEVVNE